MNATAPPARDWLLSGALWGSIGVMDAYRMAGAVNPIDWRQVAAQWAVLGITGVILGRLGRLGRAFSAPQWAPATLVFFVLLGVMPQDWTGVPYVLGLLTLTFGVTAVTVSRGWRLPAGLALLSIPALGLTIDGFKDGNLDRWAWPLRHRPLAPESPGTPIVLVSVDTLRADSAREMASWKRLTKEGAWWRSAMSTSSWTLPSVASMLTGLPPAEHKAICLANGCQAIDADARSIAQDLEDAGWRTIGITSNPWLSRQAHFDKGFQRYHDFGNDPESSLMVGPNPYLYAPQRAEGVTALALDELEHVQGQTFFWVHYVDPHWPYGSSPDVAPKGLPHTVSHTEREKVREAYAAEVALVDRQITRLLDAIEARFGSDVHVILTSDHGEELWEHDGGAHGHSHHAEVIEVPLVVAGPRVVPGRRNSVASLADIPDTLRYLAGLSDIPSLAGTDTRSREASAYGNCLGTRLCSARTTERRVIVHGCDSDTPWAEAFDLVSDPGERQPQPVPLDDPLAERALAHLPSADGEKLDAGSEALRALGYLQ